MVSNFLNNNRTKKFESEDNLQDQDELNGVFKFAEGVYFEKLRPFFEDLKKKTLLIV